MFASVNISIGTAGLRGVCNADLPAIVNYWASSSNEFLDFMGVDRQRLGSPEQIHARFSNAIRTGNLVQPALGFAITLDERLIGYTLLNHYSEHTNYSHWHIVEPGLRGKGLSTALYPFWIKAYFDSLPISRLIHQTRTRNVGVNRMLDKFIPVSETKFIEKPDGVASPGEFHLRFVRRDDIPRIFARAGQLGIISSETPWA